jgi:prepilin-type N-terminal cleavage/methylation domain-containing protein
LIKPFLPADNALRLRLQPGFTLVELTIVMLIVSILLAGVLMPLSIQMELRRYADTKKTMDLINEALIGFVLANGRLPCPADPTLADSAGTAGVERAGGCTTAATQVGVIPWVTLNVPETDEWGGRFKYRVTLQFADANGTTVASGTEVPACTPATTPTQASFALCAWGDMKVQSRATNKAPYDMTNLRLPAVFMSHGKNGYGAYGTNGTLVAAVPAANADETINATTTATTFISREKTDYSSSCSDSAGTTPMCEFDDLVAFVPLPTLMNRMVVSGKLP